MAPLPKFQAHAVGAPADVSVKVTLSGTVPDILLELKEHTGGGTVTVIVFVLEEDPPALLTVRVTV